MQTQCNTQYTDTDMDTVYRTETDTRAYTDAQKDHTCTSTTHSGRQTHVHRHTHTQTHTQHSAHRYTQKTDG